jgi:hypothetical protein
VQPEDSDGRRRVGSWSEGEAGGGSIRREPEADLKVERRMQLRGKLAVDPLAQPGWKADESRSEIDGTAGGCDAKGIRSWSKGKPNDLYPAQAGS